MDVLQRLNADDASWPAWDNPPVAADALPDPEATRAWPLEMRYLKLQLRRWFFFCLFLLAGVLVFAGIQGKTLLWGLAILPLLLFVLGRINIQRLFASRTYMLRSRDITWRSGWLWRRVVSVPYNRIQHVETGQGVIEKWYGLASLYVFTAGKSSSDLAIPGLEAEHAEKLKDYILGQVGGLQMEEE
jgi:membrane protein YdbS with pleckstrin-like domain